MSDGVAFAYRAARASGRLEAGVLRAETLEAAREALHLRGLFPVELRVHAAAGPVRRRIPAADLALGLRVMATLLEAGLPLGRTLASLGELMPPSWRSVVPELQASVREGKSLAGALGACSIEIPPVVLGLVAAGEAGSGVAPAVGRAADLTEQAAATRQAVRAALAYPLILAAAGAVSISLLVFMVLPRFAAILADLGQALPPTTRLVLGASQAARAGFVPALAALAALLLAWKLWTSGAAGRERWHALLLRAPLAGGIRRSAGAGRFAAALGALLESGVPLAAGMRHAAGAAGDAALERRILAAREAVVGGTGVASALDAADALTPTAVRLVRAGEESGRLADMLLQVSRIESARAEQGVRSAVRVIEPSLIIGFGAMVAVTAAALLQAVYSVRPGH